ncbi:MAG TPA: hypothetical protein VNH11_29370 [Pirellulales bacterium]|nr:hypothetical protein [Pirellulales bacterium]
MISRRKRRTVDRWRPLHVGQILDWADRFYARHGRWPQVDDGRVEDDKDEKWRNLDAALRRGSRGLVAGSSLARLLSKFRGKRNRKALPHYSIRLILTWADAYRRRTGRWPTPRSGPIPEAPGETWSAVHAALEAGIRGLRGGSSLPKLLAKHRGAPYQAVGPRLTEAMILAWADDHYRRTGLWPQTHSGRVAAAPHTRWSAVSKGLREGRRGLPGGSSLAQLLKQRRGVLPAHRRQPPLSIEQVLAWADAHHRRTRKWPNEESGKIREAPNESWGKLAKALRVGQRGLPGGMTLGRLLAQRRGVRNLQGLPRFRVKQIVSWIEAHIRRTGKPPTLRSGKIADAPAETWMAVHMALYNGRRGFPGGSSLAQFVRHRRAVAVRGRVHRNRRRPQ